MEKQLTQLKQHQDKLQQCRQCKLMHGPPVTGNAVLSPVMLIGQAPGHKEIEVHRPFAWTAGKTLFKWFAQIGVDEPYFRNRVYMAAVCRCYPGKNPKGGDRVPATEEISHCSGWLQQEIEILQPQLVIPVGKLAISRLMDVNKLSDVIGNKFSLELYQHKIQAIPLPHPSGVSRWPQAEPGKSLLRQALQLIKRHPAWKSAIQTPPGMEICYV